MVSYQFFCIQNDGWKSHQLGGVTDIEREYRYFSEFPVPKEIRKSICWDDQLCYIYTSGTTGIFLLSIALC